MIMDAAVIIKLYVAAVITKLYVATPTSLQYTVMLQNMSKISECLNSKEFCSLSWYDIIDRLVCHQFKSFSMDEQLKGHFRRSMIHAGYA